MSALLRATNQVLTDGRNYLARIDDEGYRESISLLSGSTIGQHTRHWIEFFQCLLVQTAESNTLDYDRRVRDKRLETDPVFASIIVDQIEDRVNDLDLSRHITLKTCLEENPLHIQTSMERELWYAVEHAIHHLALVKVGWQSLGYLAELPVDFGYAYSTRRHMATTH
ncbi:MAG: DinB family protein [Bacteroidota bacterium]